MSAKVTIQSGIAAGTSHRIERRVARVGSDPQSDVCLPTADVPGHALTLEFRDDGCRVYNRCRDSVYIGAQVVEPDQVVAWPDTDILQLGTDIELLLDFDDEPDEPAHFPHDIDESPEEPIPGEEATSGSPPSSTAKTLAQLAVTVLCIVGCVLLLARDQQRKAPKEQGPTFAELVTEAIETPTTSRELVQRIQYAEGLRLRGQRRAAMSAFEQLRDDLHPHRQQFATDDRQTELKLLALVESRLGELHK